MVDRQMLTQVEKRTTAWPQSGALHWADGESSGESCEEQETARGLQLGGLERRHRTGHLK